MPFVSPHKIKFQKTDSLKQILGAGHTQAMIRMHMIYYYVYVFWKWNWSNRNFVYNYISASHDVRLKIHLLMGCTSEKGFRISVVWNICNIACQSCKNSSPGQRLYFASVHGIQYFERNSSAEKRKKLYCVSTLVLAVIFV